MITIIFEPHATTTDNEAHLASGWNDVALSELGIKQAKELGQRYNLDDFDAIFTSDMERAYQTAMLAFGDIDHTKLRMDWRLRECDYGDLTQHPKAEVDAEKPNRISVPFPNGESYQDTAKRMNSFLGDLAQNFSGKKVMVIGHRATQYGLEHWINGVPLGDAVSAPWKWQPGWTYTGRVVPAETTRPQIEPTET
jgi:broad specificity phosphatase PhoE